MLPILAPYLEDNEVPKHKQGPRFNLQEQILTESEINLKLEKRTILRNKEIWKAMKG